MDIVVGAVLFSPIELLSAFFSKGVVRDLSIYEK